MYCIAVIPAGSPKTQKKRRASGVIVMVQTAYSVTHISRHYKDCMAKASHRQLAIYEQKYER